jgi:phosphoglycerate dehydrogenase-like enzyme
MLYDPTIFVAIRPEVYRDVFSAEADARLRQLGEVVFQENEQNLSSAELAARLPGCAIVVTGWGTPAFNDEVLRAAVDLRLIAHSAGTIKHLLPPPLFERGIAVTHAAGAIAPAVADFTLMLIMLMLRRAYHPDRALHSGKAWNAAKPPMGEEITGQRIGVVGAGYTGRCVIKLLQAVGADLWVHDPYLSDDRAAELGVHKSSLDELFANCRVVTLQAPVTEETFRMVGARQLSLLQDDAIFVNTARGILVDQDALLAELQRGRVRAALDVFDPEPLPAESPLRKLDNVFLSAHIAGASAQARHRQGSAMVEEIERFLAGQPLRYKVTQEMLATMA